MENYDVEIERGRSEINDRIFDYLLPMLDGYVLDVGCNTGYLISQYKGNALGVDSSFIMIQKAQAKGLNVMYVDGHKLPFDNKSFDTVVLSCILEQNVDWETILNEAIRVGKRVIGINPYPGMSKWGNVGGWVQSVIKPQYMFDKYNARISQVDSERYYFEI